MNSNRLLVVLLAGFLQSVVHAQAIEDMSMDELNQRCDAAREEKIAPLREQTIEECKQQPRNDPAWCERFYADFGEGGRTKNGSIRPRMFDDLPECLDALNEENRRRGSRR